ncbi:cytochrome c oxidase assembly protein [Novosphingobium mangrovi (ex Huang et al. 2023)]|uniref:Cytochrome c oxidase assembly protein CtaG n=1 Tax=Novosphingobium mangrovi (ex Huang et al. 2023) TaxID=2976432 RepID=A0ABT2I0G3_9SPHN|nr:cytochrome c oxidase assembly protein [Novosphingobium mangrovi (ex Huang et al. 2023)]MCT2398288.1 cytochrome c oxidase assembly protein [Novosphingobium mangrovi (ex Huang et al. 2023)]
MAEAINPVDRARQSNRKVAMVALSMALGMLGLGYASVPLYRIFCQVTGYGGTTKRVDAAQAAGIVDSGRTISVRFDANVARDMPWDFKPLQRTDTVSIGARDMALFWARNESDQTVTGTASFNVEPEQAAKYFNKIQCFCFTEQTLKPGEAVRMPVLYYIDPAILDDPDNKDVEEITLSYTFHVTSVGDAKALDQSKTGG